MSTRWLSGRALTRDEALRRAAASDYDLRMIGRITRLDAVALALCALGMVVAGYLTYVHYAGIDPVCASGSGGCHTVQSSEYAELFGVPVSLIGLCGYLAIAVAVWVRGPRARGATAILSGAGCAFSVYLTYLELFVIHAICQWCVASAVLMSALCVICAIRYVRG